MPRVAWALGTYSNAIISVLCENTLCTGVLATHVFTFSFWAFWAFFAILPPSLLPFFFSCFQKKTHAVTHTATLRPTQTCFRWIEMVCPALLPLCHLRQAQRCTCLDTCLNKSIDSQKDYSSCYQTTLFMPLLSSFLLCVIFRYSTIFPPSPPGLYTVRMENYSDGWVLCILISLTRRLFIESFCSILIWECSILYRSPENCNCT